MNILNYRNENGMTMVAILILLSVISILAASYLFVATVETRLASNKTDSYVCFQAADAGIEYGRMKIVTDINWKQQHTRRINSNNFPSQPWTYIDRPSNAWDQQTIPNPDGSISYFRTWIEERPEVNIDTLEVEMKSYILSN